MAEESFVEVLVIFLLLVVLAYLFVKVWWAPPVRFENALNVFCQPFCSRVYNFGPLVVRSVWGSEQSVEQPMLGVGQGVALTVCTESFYS